MANPFGKNLNKLSKFGAHVVRGDKSTNIEDVSKQSASDKLIDAGQGVASGYKPGGVPAKQQGGGKTGNPFGKNKDASPPAPDNGGVGGFLYGGLRNFNDMLTMGLWDKFLEATKIQPNASELTDAADPWAKVAGRTLGGIPLGMGVSKGLAETIPWLARNQIAPIVANNAATSGIISTGDQLVHEGKVDPLRLAIDTAGGGVLGGVLAGLSRGGSSGARVRARGNDLTPADKAAMQQTMGNAANKGIALTVPEAAATVARPRAGDLLALDEYARSTPGGSRVIDRFNSLREPGITQAGEDVARSLPAIRPFDIQMAAQDAIEGTKKGFGATTRPYFDASVGKKVAPSAGKKLMRNSPGVAEAAKATARNKTTMGFLTKEIGRPAQVNDIAFLDAVQKQMKKTATMPSTSPISEAGLPQSAQDVLSVMDRFSPKIPAGSKFRPGESMHAVARDIHGQGQDAIAALEAGPLGRIAKSAKANAQGKALYGAETATEGEVARDAVGHLPTDTAQGILANHIDAATTKHGPRWADHVVPPHGEAAAEKALGNRAIDVLDTIRSARATDTRPAGVHDMEAQYPWTFAFQLARNLGGKGVAEKLRDPRWIARLGKLGPLQQLLTQMATSANRTASQRRAAGND